MKKSISNNDTSTTQSTIHNRRDAANSCSRTVRRRPPTPTHKVGQHVTVGMNTVGDTGRVVGFFDHNQPDILVAVKIGKKILYYSAAQLTKI